MLLPCWSIWELLLSSSGSWVEPAQDPRSPDARTTGRGTDTGATTAAPGANRRGNSEAQEDEEGSRTEARAAG